MSSRRVCFCKFFQDAFPKMSNEQVAHMNAWLRDEYKKLNTVSEDETLARLKVIGENVEHLASDLHVVKLNVAVCTSRLRDDLDGGQTGLMRATLMGKSPS